MHKKEEKLKKLLSQIQDLRSKIIDELKSKKQLEIRVSQIREAIILIEKEFDNDVISFPRDLTNRLKSKNRELKEANKNILLKDKLLWGEFNSKKLGIVYLHDKLEDQFKKICISDPKMFEYLLGKSSDRYLESLENTIKLRFSNFKSEPTLTIKELDEVELNELMLDIQGGMISRTEELILNRNNEQALNEEIEKTILIFRNERSKLNLSDIKIESKFQEPKTEETELANNSELPEVLNERPKIISVINEYCESNKILLLNENLTELARKIYIYARDKSWKYTLESIRVTLVKKRTNE